LFRFYDVDKGGIFIDGVDVRDCTQSSLRQALGVVPQDTVMFNDTIRYNLAYAHPDADDARVYEAARRANLAEFIAQLPQGYETIVGERGLKLSGGEKQRMAIARVVIKDPPIIIFDEATSSLDTRSEQAILEGMNAVARRATSLVIAHRLSTIVDADQILVLDAGRIVQRGNHESLLASGGLYADLWQLQLGAEENAA
jgi:ATP-binding cassette subfamily B protein